MKDEKFKFYAIWLAVVCVVIFVLQVVIPGFTEMFVLDKAAYQNFEVWRFVSSIFLHGSVIHLVFNMFALILFGSIAERFIGSRNLLITFFVSGVVANIISVGFYDSALGASGAIFGIIGVLVIVRPLMTIWAFGLPMPMFIAGVLWVIGDLIGTYGFFVGNPMDNTGNIAHLTGVFVGLLMGVFYRRAGASEKTIKKFKVELDEADIRRWEDVYMDR